MTFASHFSFIFIVFARENNLLCRDFFVKGNLQEAYYQNISGLFVMNFSSHVIKRRQHSIERDEDLHAVIEWKKKKLLYFTIEASK